MDILLVIDMQNDFVKETLNTKEALEIVDILKEKIENFEGQVIYTLDTHDKNYLQSQEGRNLPIKHCIKNTWGHEIIDEFKACNNFNHGKFFEKNTFGSKDLVKYLVDLDKREDIGKIYFTGVCTDICVVSNALLIKAFLPEIELLIYKDLCAGLNKEKHKAALDVLDSCQVYAI